jgi:DNA-binding transcriptional ArsR family regulator
VTIAVAAQKTKRDRVSSLDDTVAIFGALAHLCRLRMLILLAERQVCDVTTLTHLCGKPQPYITQQLRILREAGLVTGEQEGLHVCYRIANPRVKAILQAAGVWEHEPKMSWRRGLQLGATDQGNLHRAGRGQPRERAAASKGAGHAAARMGRVAVPAQPNSGGGVRWS